MPLDFEKVQSECSAELRDMPLKPQYGPLIYRKQSKEVGVMSLGAYCETDPDSEHLTAGLV